MKIALHTLRLTLLALLFAFCTNAQNIQLYDNGNQPYNPKVNPGTKAAVFYSSYVYNFGSEINNTLNNLVVSVVGTATEIEVPVYRLYTSYNYYLDGSALLLGTIPGVDLSTGQSSLSFVGINFPITTYYTNGYRPHYFFVAADVDANASEGIIFASKGVQSAKVSTLTSGVYNGSSKTLGTVHTITSTLAAGISTFTNYTESASAGQNEIQFFRLNTTLTGGTVSFKSLTLPLSGTFIGADFDALKLYYRDPNSGIEFLVASVAGSLLSTGGIVTFETANPFSLRETGGQFKVKANISNNANPGSKLIIDTFLGANFELDDFLFEGEYTGLSSIQISNPPTISIEDKTTTQDAFSPGSSDNLLYKAKITASGSAGVLNEINFRVAGTYTAADVASFTLWVSTNSTFYNYSPYKISTITLAGIGGVLNFTGFEREVSNGNQYYIYLTADIEDAATLGSTLALQVVSIPSSFGFAAGSITGTAVVPTLKTIKSPAISIASIAIAAGKIGLGTDNNVIFKLKITATNANAILNKAAFNLAGDFNSEDSRYFRLYYGTTSAFENASDIDNLNYYNGAGGSVTFTGLDLAIAKDAEIYLFLAVRAEDEAIAGKKINVAAGSLQNFEFISGSKTGSITVGSIFTYTKPTVSVESIALPAGIMGVNTDVNIFYKIKLNVSNADAILNSYDLNTGGSYNSTDLEYYYSFRTIYSRNEIYGDGDDVALVYEYGSNSTGAGENLNSSPNYKLPVGANYLFFTTDIATNAVDGHTLNMKNSNAASAIKVPGTTVTGSLAAGASFTIAKPFTKFTTLATTNSTILGANNNNQLIYSLELDNANLPAYLNNISIALAGNFTSSDIGYYYLYMSASPTFNKNNSIDNYYHSASGTGQIINFLVGYLPKGKTYLHLVANVRTIAENGNTINVVSTTGIQISNGTFTGAGIQAGVVYSIGRIAAIETVATQNFLATAGTTNFLYGFKVTPNSNFSFDQLVLSISGSLDAVLLSNYFLYYSNDIDSPQNANAYVNGTFSTSSGQNLSFTGMSFGMSFGNTYYFYVSASIASTTTLGNTIKIQPESLNSFTFNNGTTVVGNFALGKSYTTVVPAVSIATIALPSKSLNPDGGVYAIYAIEFNANAPVNINSFPLSFVGSYSVEQVNGIYLYRNYGNELNPDYANVASTVAKYEATVPGEGFNPTINYTLPAGKSYFNIVIGLDPTTTTGATIKVKAISVAGIALSSGTLTGTSIEGNVFTIKNSVVSISSIAIAGKYLPIYSTEPVYTIKLNVAEADAKILNIKVQTKGTYNDVNDFYYLKAYITKSPVFNSLDNPDYDQVYLGSGNGTIYSITLAEKLLSIGDNYIHLLSYRQGTFNSNTFGIESVTINSSNFKGGKVTVNGSLATGELHTVLGSYLSTYASASIPVEGGKINKGTSKLVYAAKLSVFNAIGNLSSIYLQTKGNFVEGDINYIRLWASTSATFDASAKSITGIVPYFTGSNLNFSINSYLPIGDHFFYVTADVSPNATSGNSFYIESTTSTNFYFNYALSSTGYSLRTPTYTFGVPSNNSDIASFSLPGQLGTTSIIGTSIVVNFPIGSSLNALVAQFGIDADASAFVGATKQITGVSANNFTNSISYIITSETGLTKIYTVTVNFVNLTSTDASEIPLGVEIYPNPASGMVYIQSPAYTKAVIYDLIGNTLGSFDLNETNQLNIAGLAEGVYFIKLYNSSKSTVKKLVVRH